MSDDIAEGVKVLVIVARDQPELYEHVRRPFAGDGRVQVIRDRRRGGSRPPDERGGERRRPQPGQEVPADVPVSIRSRSTAPSPPDEAPHGRPDAGHDGPIGRRPAQHAAVLQSGLRVIDAALAVARPLSAFLHQRQFQRHEPSTLDPLPISAPEGAQPKSRSRPGPAPGP